MIRTSLAAAALAAAISLAPSARSAGIPTIDTASLAAQLSQHIDRYRELQNIYREAEATVRGLERQYEAMTGARNLGDILRNPLIRRYVPAEWWTVFRKARRAGIPGLDVAARKVYDDMLIFDACAFESVRARRVACEAPLAIAAQQQAHAHAIGEFAEVRSGIIEGLRVAIRGATDPKAIAELQARIAIEQAEIDNEATRIEAFRIASAAESDAAIERRRQITARTFSSRRTPVVEPITFEPLGPRDGSGARDDVSLVREEAAD